ncbi:MAG: aliphatic sulfonate ABC transporter substrate-binding protein [Galactobacter sp.]
MTRRSTTRLAATGVALIAATSLLASCAGEGSGGDEAKGGGSDTLTIDWATYNPLSMVIKDQGWLEDELKEDGVKVEWVQSAGSNKANEGLRAGALDVGSTAGSAALLNRSNGSPIKVIGIADQPEWAAIVTRSDSSITSAADLKGKKIAATKGTDPYFFLLQALGSADLAPSDVTVENLQHADGRQALNGKAVDAWAGLDPIMGAAEADGDELRIRNVDYNTYDTLAATESFIKDSPETAQTVLDTYEYARQWAAENPEKVVEIVARDAAIDPAVAKKVIDERINLEVSVIPGEDQTKVLSNVGQFLVDSGDVPDADTVKKGLDSLLDPTFAEKADADNIKGE